jgi:hypothetical protein
MGKLDYEEFDQEKMEKIWWEYRRLRELAMKLPGPETADPKDKIWLYLIAEYGFTPETLLRMSYRDMKRYIEARPPRDIKNQEMAKGSKEKESPTIPSEYRTRPMTMIEAAGLMGYCRTRGPKEAVKALRAAINGGEIHCERLTRQQHIFDRREFPDESQAKLTPTDPKRR